MEGSLEKTLSFLLFIGIGILLRKKIPAGDQTKGLKNLILTIALPATIFIALLKININGDLLLYPLLALTFNVTLFAIAPLLLLIVDIKKNTTTGRSASLLLPSLAPGLSCFPFILEFLGDAALAKAAMADLGNKFFVLFLLYLVALKWHFNHVDFTGSSLKSKLKMLLKTMIYEPVNLFILIALVLVFLGINLESLPNFLSLTLTRLSFIMTPLVLLFIGLAVKLHHKQFFQIFSLLLLRASFTLALITGFIAFTNTKTPATILMMIAFCLSACSFWPFAHISAVDAKEQAEKGISKTFNVNFALSILALSLPISVLLILGVLTAGNTFTSITNILLLSGSLATLGIIYPVVNFVKKGIIAKKSTIQFITEK